MKIAIYATQFKEEYREILLEILTQFPVKNNQVFLFEPLYIAAKKSVHDMRGYSIFKTYKDLDASFEAMLTIGGDGTILRAITYVRHHNIPILGINAGRLGFLATVSKENITQAIEQLQQKDYTTSEKTLLQIQLFDESGQEKTWSGFHLALNEITISRKNTTSMIVIDSHLNDEFLNSYWADGLIISTPTGSTGYSLSCGGPIILPEVDSWVVTPIAPHNLNVRPLILPASSVIRLKVSSREDSFLVALDSRVKSLSCKCEIQIQKADFKIHMIKLPQERFLNTIRQKLLWGEDKRSKNN